MNRDINFGPVRKKGTSTLTCTPTVYLCLNVNHTQFDLDARPLAGFESLNRADTQPTDDIWVGQIGDVMLIIPSEVTNK